MLSSLLVIVALAMVVQGNPEPSRQQLEHLDMGLTMFQHFSVDPFSSIEHNCVGTSPECIPVSAFNPTNLDTDQWVSTAAAFGAKEICLTAHHEGGFCLWDSEFCDGYSVMDSPYGKDIVKQFVASCKKYNIKPCYYMGPNANGWLANNRSYSAEKFVTAQLGMLRELLTKYGTDYVGRLWWDHYPSGCGGLAPCPNGSFPAAWPQFVSLVRELSPSTLICPGPDCDGHQGESGLGKYPVWMNCNPEYSADGKTELTCDQHAPDASLIGFHPYETCATMASGWFCKGDGDSPANGWWNASTIWDHYIGSVGIGWINTLNAPPCTTGQIHPTLVESMKTFGKALSDLLKPITQVEDVVNESCNNESIIELSTPYFSSSSGFNAIITSEDLSRGQRIVQYALDYTLDGETWFEYPAINASSSPIGVHGQSIGVRVIDFVPEMEAKVKKVRFRCIDSLQLPIRIKSFSLHRGNRPT